MPRLEHTPMFTNTKCLRSVRSVIVQSVIKDVRMPPPDFKFITQTLSPKLYKKNAHSQFLSTLNDLVSVLDYVSNDYCLCTELTEDSNVHYHFWIVFKEKYTFAHYIEIIKSNFKFGFTKMTKIKYEKTTLRQQTDSYNYLIKDIEKTYCIVRSRQIVINKSDHGIDVDIDEDI